MFKDEFIEKPFTTAEFCNFIKRLVKKKAKNPEKSFLQLRY